MPNQPTHPLVDADDAENLLCDLRGYLAVVQQLCCLRMEGAGPVNDYQDVEHGTFMLLAACREGVHVLAYMDSIGKITKLEGKS